MFLPLCLIGFYILKTKYETMAKVWLIGFSLWFYGAFRLNYVVIMIGSILFNYIMSMMLLKMKQNNKRILVIGVIGNIMLLGYFKYYDFFVTSINDFFAQNFMIRNIVLPLGISFFTFQQISFLVDTYKGRLKTIRFIDYTLFVSFFPQLIAGPIVSGEEIVPQLNMWKKKYSDTQITSAILYFVCGMFKKVIVADTFGNAVNWGYANIDAMNRLDGLLVILFYSFQIYYDFSGYCDMAKGLGLLFGIQLPNNFDSPYKARNIIEFWKRWHITLSRFLTNNVYIPLGGNRVGNITLYRNILLVFLISGIWHGAGWNFILWGMLHGILYVGTKVVMTLRKGRSSNKIMNTASHIFTFFFLNITWVFFRSENIEQAKEFFVNLIRKPIGPIHTTLSSFLIWKNFGIHLRV